MSWIDRILPAKYKSPSGREISFTYEDVSLLVEKKTTAFESPDADGTYIQDQGVSGRRIPMIIFFHGEDYDREADTFLELLSERGTGVLTHPVYGVRNVVPFGPIKRDDALKRAGNQAVFSLTFWETTDAIYPTGDTDPAAQVVSAVEEYNAAAATAFEDTTSLSTTVETASLKGSYEVLLGAVTDGLADLAAVQADVQNQFNTVNASINAGIDTLISDPLTLAFQTVILIQAPARATAAIDARLDAYKNLLADITSQATATPGFDSESLNKFRADDLFGSTYISASVLSSVNNQFETKTDALAAADAILSQLDDLIAWRDDNFASLEAVDTGEAYQQLIEAVGLAAGFLVEISFSLKQERVIVLSRARTIIDLVAELYGSVDAELDFLITSNNLSGSEILELPAGREIRYYV